MILERLDSRVNIKNTFLFEPISAVHVTLSVFQKKSLKITAVAQGCKNFITIYGNIPMNIITQGKYRQLREYKNNLKI